MQNLYYSSYRKKNPKRIDTNSCIYADALNQFRKFFCTLDPSQKKPYNTVVEGALKGIYFPNSKPLA
jgi:hypothetical protein